MLTLNKNPQQNLIIFWVILVLQPIKKNGLLPALSHFLVLPVD